MHILTLELVHLCFAKMWTHLEREVRSKPHWKLPFIIFSTAVTRHLLWELDIPGCFISDSYLPNKNPNLTRASLFFHLFSAKSKKKNIQKNPNKLGFRANWVAWMMNMPWLLPFCPFSVNEASPTSWKAPGPLAAWTWALAFVKPI